MEAFVAELDEEAEALGERRIAKTRVRRIDGELLDLVERELRAAPNARADDVAVEHGRAFVEQHVEDERTPRTLWIERHEAFRERARQHGDAETRQVETRAAKERVGEER